MDIQRHRRRLSGGKFAEKEYVRLDLRNAVAQSSFWEKCHFSGCAFDQAALGDATFLQCEFVGCSFRQSTIVSRIYETSFNDCNFDQALFTGADIKDSKFVGCRAQYSNWDRATLTNVKVSADLHGARLDLACSDGVDWSGSNLWGAVVPLNCAFIASNRFDRRQLHMFLALLQYSTGNVEDLDDIDRIVDDRYRKLVRRLVRHEEGTPESNEPETLHGN